MARPDTAIVSLTVTEKGYCHNPATGELDEAHPGIRHDLITPGAPQTAIGFMVEALARRRAAGLLPFTVLSCDNLPANGRTVRRVLLRYAALRDAELARYLTDTLACPSSMVDRIVPATTDADGASVSAALGVEDAWPVMTEPFTQWVIEDRFAGARPAWEAAGATLVSEVEPYELMKLRLLNGSHSTMSYLGYLAGREYISDVMAEPDFVRLVHGLMTEEAIPTLDMPGVDLGAYRDQLLDRFSNPALKHRTWQIAMDGSQKLPQRLLGTIRDRLAVGQPFPRLALGVAAWMRYVTGVDENGEEIDVRDPHALRMHAIAADAGDDPKALFDGLVALSEVFGTDLPGNAAFRDAVLPQLESLFENGAAETVKRVG
jgi:fructuronate reductase